MGVPRWVAATLLVANVELRRSWRRLLRPSPYRTLKVVVGLLFLGAYALGAGAAGFAVAALLGTGAVSSVETRLLGIARSVTAGFLAMVVFFAVQRTVKGKGVPDGAPILLTSTSPYAVGLGLLLAETVRVLLVAIAPLLAFASGLAIGFGRPLAVIGVAGTLVGVLVTAVTIGFAIGLGIKNIAARSRFVARHRLVANLLGSVVILGGYLVLLADPGRINAVSDVLRDHPVGWPADLALAATPIATRPERAGVAVLALLVIPVLVGAVISRLARYLYYTDPLVGDRADGSSRRRRVRGFVPLDLDGVTTRPTRVVTLKAVRRVLRAPYTAQYAILPLFFLFYEAQAFAVSGVVPPRLPAVLGVAAAWATGALFSLNPIGLEEPVLPVTLTTGVAGRSFIGGLAVAGILIGLPLGVLAVLGAAIVGGMVAATVAPVLASVVVLCLATPGIAAALGVRFPKRQATAIGRGREIVLPSPWAFLGYSILVLGCGAPLIAGQASVASSLINHPAVSVERLGMIGAVTSMLVAAVVGTLAYHDAIARLREYRLD